MGTLDGKVAIVSGSGRGIGRDIALRLASEGASVVVNDLDPEPAHETVEDIKAAGGHAIACVGSVTDDDFAERFVGTAIDAFDGLDIIVNNAGYRSEEHTSELQSLMRISYAVFCLKKKKTINIQQKINKHYTKKNKVRCKQ